MLVYRWALPKGGFFVKERNEEDFLIVPMKSIIVILSPVDDINIKFPWSSKEKLACIYFNHITCNHILIMLVNGE